MTEKKIIRHLERAYDALLDAQFEVFDKPEFKNERFKLSEIQKSIGQLDRQVKELVKQKEQQSA